MRAWLGTGVVIVLMALYTAAVIATIFVKGYSIPASLTSVVVTVVGVIVSGKLFGDKGDDRADDA